MKNIKILDIPVILKRLQRNHVRREQSWRKKWAPKDLKKPYDTHPTVEAWQTRKHRFKACNGKCTLDIPSLAGWSYDWWQVVKVINGKIVFNDYNYSATTSGHQSQIKSWLSDLGLAIDLVIECPAGLQDASWAKSSVRHYAYEIAYLEALKAYGTKSKNELRDRTIKTYVSKIQAIRELSYVSRKDCEDIRVSAESNAKQAVARERQIRKDRKVQRVLNKLLGNVA